MANQEVKFSNFYESTLATGGLPTNVTTASLTAAPTSDGTTSIGANYYLVVDPDNASSREVIEVTAATGATLTTITRDKEGRYGTPGDASTAPNHAEGTVVRMAVVKEMFEDVHDRIDAGVTADSATTFTNKTISSASNTLSIDAADIADGSVSDTEFQYLNGVTSSIQTQIDGKASIGLIIALGG